ncbi:MFS transporter [Paenarthrobacter sp. DKR-5]|uniref:MFS transporter n=1 Tax=Paenarthrobacter sp. DKR-5 TaxID=2835535 RepID=UPI001BDBB593|nr:MFS transporter [Paenarthrobacter sp. DKR-5]MBT1001938.1 MFS transporter [Paenarthrobacter sp. DKR-5]
MVFSFGLVSLAVDLVSDGGRSLAGPLLGSLGASALTVGLVTGAGEALAQGLRLLTGPWADRTRGYWSFTIAGYAMTALSIPLLALAPFAGTAGLLLGSVLLLADRTGKAVRSPAKTVLLAGAAGSVGRGRGFAVHKSLDQFGAFLGPLLAAGMVAVSGTLWAAFAVLALPALAALAILLAVRRGAPDPAIPAGPNAAAGSDLAGTRLPRSFYFTGLAVFAANAGLVTFGLISFHLTDARLAPLAVAPLFYAAAMAMAAVAALASGFLYDRAGPRVLLVLPVLIALVPGLALADRLPLVFAGVLSWGAAAGIQDSTLKALVADLVAAPRRGTAYGVVAAFEGAGALAGGFLAGALYSRAGTLALAVALIEAAAFLLLLAAVRPRGAGGLLPARTARENGEDG